MVWLVRAATDRNPPSLGGGGCQVSAKKTAGYVSEIAPVNSLATIRPSVFCSAGERSVLRGESSLKSAKLYQIYLILFIKHMQN